MTVAPRLLVACALAAGAALLVTSCVAALGLDEEKKDAVDRFCSCIHAQNLYGAQNAKALCVADITADLEAATEPTRAAWMQYYEKNCSTCPDAADDWRLCLGQKPTCGRESDPCKPDFDSCCTAGACSAEGKCGP